MNTHSKSLTDGLEFDEEKHQYVFKGRVLPSVTTILHETGCSGRGFERGAGPNPAALMGTIVHSYAERLVDTGEKDTEVLAFLEEEKMTGFATSVDQFLSRHTVNGDWEVVYAEAKFVGPSADLPLYGGTADLILWKKDGDGHEHLWIVDWKTGIERPEHGLQLAAYAAGISRHFDFPCGRVWTSGAYLRTDVEKTYVKPFPWLELANVWQGLLGTYQWMVKNNVLEEV